MAACPVKLETGVNVIFVPAFVSDQVPTPEITAELLEQPEDTRKQVWLPSSDPETF
jgi:hypothetical protein